MFMKSRRACICLAFVLTSMALHSTASAQGGGAANPPGVREEQVRYAGGESTLAATLFLPPSTTRAPAIVLIHGAEGMPRQSAHYRQSALWFVSQGYAVLVWDKRGVGESPGTYVEGRDLRESATDVLAGVRYLTQRSEIDKARIGVFGVSQGGWIGPIAASMSDDVAFVINNSGPGTTVMEANIAQRANEWIEDGYTAADTAQIKEFLRVTWRYYGTGVGFDVADRARTNARQYEWFTKIGFSAKTPTPDALNTPNYDYYRRSQFDPDSILRKVKVPILAVFGEKDRHIAMPESAQRFEAILRAANHPDFVVKTFKDAGHGIRAVAAGDFERLRGGGGGHGASGYAPEYLPFLAAWLSAHTGRVASR